MCSMLYQGILVLRMLARQGTGDSMYCTVSLGGIVKI